MSDQTLDFSFSGLKTAVSLHVKRNRPLAERDVADIAASFQAAAVKMLVRKTSKAARQLGATRLVLTGGVAANTALRESLAAAAAEQGLRLHVPPRSLCTDNAAMIAAAGTARLMAGERAGMDLNAIADLRLESAAERSEARSEAAARAGHA
jgi:N6-L-threonylcarbamoyladenine synthase